LLERRPYRAPRNDTWVSPTLKRGATSFAPTAQGLGLTCFGLAAQGFRLLTFPPRWSAIDSPWLAGGGLGAWRAVLVHKIDQILPWPRNRFVDYKRVKWQYIPPGGIKNISFRVFAVGARGRAWSWAAEEGEKGTDTGAARWGSRNLEFVSPGGPNVGELASWTRRALAGELAGWLHLDPV
jgi:hypothetical protein